MKINSDFWRGFLAGWCCGILALSLLLAVAGCKIEHPSSKQEPRYGIIDTVTVDGDTLYVESVPPKMAAGETWYSSAPTGSVSAAAKVAAVMAEAGITLPQVAAYLNTYGFDVIDRSRLTRWQWSPAPAGTYPVAYYVANFRVATGDTSLVVYCPVTAGPYWMRVKAYDGHGNSGPWSQSSVSGPGDLLPGVAE